MAIASYLDAREHLRAAAESGADAIHPGYGFLAESPDFAEAVVRAGLTWIGPPPAALRSGGDKLEAKRLAAAAGVPTIPEGDDPPLIVKAAAGGGGRGMRVVRSRAELAGALEAARREAQAAFGDDRVYVERYLERPRHSRCSCSPTPTDAFWRSANATARCSAGTRRSSRSRLLRASTRPCATTCSPRRSGSPRRSATAVQARSSSSSTGANSSSSS